MRKPFVTTLTEVKGVHLYVRMWNIFCCSPKRGGKGNMCLFVDLEKQSWLFSFKRGIRMSMFI